MKPGIFIVFCSLLLSIGRGETVNAVPCLTSVDRKECKAYFATESAIPPGAGKDAFFDPSQADSGLTRNTPPYIPLKGRTPPCAPLKGGCVSLVSKDAVQMVFEERITSEARLVKAPSTYHVVDVFPEIDLRRIVLFPATADDLNVPTLSPVSETTWTAHALHAHLPLIPIGSGWSIQHPISVGFASPTRAGAGTPPLASGRSVMTSLSPSPSGLMPLPEPPERAVLVETVAQQMHEQQMGISPSPGPSHQGRGTGPMILVDVREKRQFDQVRIPGSINIPLFAITTKAFLKHKPLILIDEGYSPHRLENACKQLQQAGVDARFLFGGLNAWRMWSAQCILPGSANFNLPRSAHVHVLPLQGDVFAQNALNKMPPHALFAERGGKYWLLIDVSTSGEARNPGSAGASPAFDADILSAFPGEGNTPLPPSRGEFTPALPGTLPEGDLFSQALSVPFDPKNPKQFLSNFEDIIAYSEWRLVLLYNRHGQDYEELEWLLPHTDVNTVFFLEGGANAYIRFVAQQSLIGQAHAHSEKSLETCPRCP